MSMRIWCLSAALLLCALPQQASATENQEATLTLVRVVELSAANAPEVRLSATRVAEEEAKLAGAQVRTLENPKLEAAIGPRYGAETNLDAELGIEIPIEIYGRRAKRIALAQAGIQRETHGTDEARRQAVTAAVGAYYRVLQAEERLVIARDRRKLAEELLRIATERYSAGDAPKFEVNLAKTEMTQADSEISSVQGRLALARAMLARTLGLSSGSDLKVKGDLRDRSLFDAIRFATPEARPDLLATLAEVEAANAAVSLAEAEQRPELALRLSYQRENGSENIALAGVSVSLPFLNPRNGPVQEAQARRSRALIAAEARKAAISAELEGARRAYGATVESVHRMETDGVALQRENESLALESYRAGKINLSTLMQVRRDALETRREYLERLLEAADAGVELASAHGKWSTN